MATTVAKVLERFKADVGRALSPQAIRRACADLGHAYRPRVLDSVATVHAFLLQVLHGNAACSELPRLTGRSFSADAYANARSRPPDALIERLFERARDPGDDPQIALARPPALAPGWVELLDAGPAGTARGLRAAGQPERRLRLPRRPGTWSRSSAR
jgi:AcrR family transcriptional regulator